MQRKLPAKSGRVKTSLQACITQKKICAVDVKNYPEESDSEDYSESDIEAHGDENSPGSPFVLSSVAEPHRSGEPGSSASLPVELDGDSQDKAADSFGAAALHATATYNVVTAQSGFEKTVTGSKRSNSKLFSGQARKKAPKIRGGSNVHSMAGGTTAFIGKDGEEDNNGSLLREVLGEVRVAVANNSASGTSSTAPSLLEKVERVNESFANEKISKDQRDKIIDKLLGNN